VVAVDKSMTEALGPKWHQRDRKRGKVPKKLRNVDRDSGWGYSRYKGWVQGYSWHVVCSATAGHLPIPLLAEVEPNNVSENRIFEPMIEQLPEATRRVLADEGYDDQTLLLKVEIPSPHGFRRRMMVPMKAYAHTPAWRRAYVRWYQSESGQALYRQRKITIEPLFEILQNTFEHRRSWIKGLRNNQAIMLLIVLCYQLLIYYNWVEDFNLSSVKAIVDGL
jgi:hypothetical protein